MILRNMIFIIALFAIGLSNSNNNNDIVKPRDLIRVEGHILAEVPADFASFDFTVTGTGKDLRTAVSAAKMKIKAISSALFEVGLEENNLSTSHFYSGENFENKAFFSSNRDYVASIKVIVQLYDLDLLEPAVLVVSENDIDQLSDISYKLKNIEKIKSDTYEKAVLKAKEKALMIQRNLEIKNIRAINVEEVAGSRYPNPFNAVQNSTVEYSPYSSIDGVPLFYAETIKVSVRIRVTYEITF